MSELEVRPSDELEEAALKIVENPSYVIPFTGEQIDLRKPEEVAAALGSVRQAKSLLDEVRGFLSAVLRLESRRRGTKTLRYGDLEVEIRGGSKPDYDIELLRSGLAEAGCPDGRIEEVIKTEVRYTVDWRIIRQLEGANPEYAAAIARARSRVDAPWSVYVKRA